MLSTGMAWVTEGEYTGVLPFSSRLTGNGSPPPGGRSR